AHSRELVHRDLKPHNIWVRALGDGTDHVEVLDFGLARFVGDAAKRGPKLTKAGALIGTPAYMAPEQASGEAVDARADVYAMGIVTFETLTGRKPFESNDPGEILRSHLLLAPPRLAQADPGLRVSDELEALVARALAKSPSERFQSINDMLAALDALPPDACVRIGPRPPRDQPLRRGEATQRPAEATRAATPGAVRARAAAAETVPGPETSIHLPKSRWPLLAGLGCAAALLAGGAVALALAIGAGGSSDARPAPSPPTSVAPAPAPEPPTPPSSSAVPDERSSEVAPRDLLAEPLPAELAPIAARIARVTPRRMMSRRDLGALSRWDRDHPGDPRAALLLARGFANQRSLTLALSHYERAYAMDRSVRGDPRMLPDLLEMVRANTPQLSEDASRLVVEAYGSEAREAVEAAIREETRPEERARLERLRRRILEGEAP
ncbi:MAG TPA: serine/threonine-protein kinase, partial [Sandaracinaceae bacterium]